MSKYRLTPKPGIARAGRFVNTQVSPVIITSKPGVVRVQQNQKSADKIAKAEQVKKVIIKKPDKKPVRKKRATPRSQSQYRSSPLKRRKEIEIGRYKKAVEGLRGKGQGRLLIMVACGPSISEVQLPKLKGHPRIDIMSINKPDPRLYPTDYWVFCDQSQFTRNRKLFEEYQGTIINAWSVRARHQNQILIRNRSGRGFSKNLLQGYYIGRSTTFANMQVAYWMGYDKVFIFGCDMCKPPNVDKLHFYGTNPDVDPSIRAKRFAKEAEHYQNGSKQLSPAERKKFVFCSSYNPWPFIKQFEQMDHKIAIDHILKLANDLEQK